MGQSGTATGLLVILVVALGTIDWTNGASLEKPDLANQMDIRCEQSVAMEKTESSNVLSKHEAVVEVGRCKGLGSSCGFGSDCCSGICGHVPCSQIGVCA